jgi:hypothetical protein
MECCGFFLAFFYFKGKAFKAHPFKLLNRAIPHQEAQQGEDEQTRRAQGVGRGAVARGGVVDCSASRGPAVYPAAQRCRRCAVSRHFHQTAANRRLRRRRAGGCLRGAPQHPRLRDAVWAGSCAGLTVSAGARTVAHARPCLPCHLPFRNWLSGPGSSRRRRREGWARAARPRRAWYRL